jgi:two-component system, OmpR family, response regulator
LVAGREEKLLKISDVAEKAKVLPSTIRHYTDIGLLKFAATTEGGHRLYDEEETLTQMARVKLLSARGLSLPQIRAELGPEAKKRILVVDDEPEVGDLVKDVLSARHPFEIKVAMDGFTAGRMVLDVLPDLVILDLMLPGVNGFDVCRQIRADDALRGSKILAVTGYDTPENIKKIMDAGADAYLVKPFDTRDLVRAVGKLLKIELSEPASH